MVIRVGPNGAPLHSLGHSCYGIDNLGDVLMNMLTIIIDVEEGATVPDLKARDFAKDVIEDTKDSDVEVTIGSEILLLAFREAIYQERLPHTNVILRSSIGDQRFDKEGGLSEYPAECRIWESLLYTLAGWNE